MVKPSDIANRKVVKQDNPAPEPKVKLDLPPVKKPFVLKPHLTDKVGRTHPQLNELRQSLTRKNQPNVRIRNK